jgi:uncharacterized protein (DUF302 family)
MKRRLFIKLTGCCFLSFYAIPKNIKMNTQGIITRTSPFEVKETMDRLVLFLEKNGATIYNRIDQQKEVRRTGREIHPMEFLLFGNPANGGAIMAVNSLAALDLPLKILAWKGDDQVVRVAYNDAEYLQNRYSLPSKLTASLDLSTIINKVLTK